MIASIRGEISQVEDNAIVVEVNGLGLRLFIPGPLKARLKTRDMVLLYTHLVVREDDWKLFGFETMSDRDMFVLLLGTDGVGPRTALAVMSGISMETLQRAVFGDEPDLLGRVPGVGKKTAQKIVLYLHDRLKPSDTFKAVAALSDADSEVLAALTALGYSVVEAQTAIQSIPRDSSQDVGERLRLALQQFSGK